MHNKIILTQGLFKNRNRNSLMGKFRFARFVWIDAENEICEKRVSERKNEITKDYARRINEYFEIPDFKCFKLINNSDDREVLKQAYEIENLIKKKSELVLTAKKF